MTSSAYTAAYNEVKNLGGAEIHDATHRRATFIGIFWGMMGRQFMCASETLQSDHGANCRPEEVERHSIRAHCWHW